MLHLLVQPQIRGVAAVVLEELLRRANCGSLEPDCPPLPLAATITTTTTLL